MQPERSRTSVSVTLGALIVLVSVAVGLWPSRIGQTITPTSTGQPTDERAAVAEVTPTVSDPTPLPPPTFTQTTVTTLTPSLDAKANPVRESATVSDATEPSGIGGATATAANEITVTDDVAAGQGSTAASIPFAAGTPTPSPLLTAPEHPPPTPAIAPSTPISRELGLSTDGWPIEVWQFGHGPVRLAFVGGIHGGYEWNTILLAYMAIDYFTLYPEKLPHNVSLFIIPAANPDGHVKVLDHTGRFTMDEVKRVTLAGRFNGNGVDLNRNWDCEWDPVGYLRDLEINAGTAPFSEVETRILRDFLSEMDAAVFWHSAHPGVYFGECETPFPESQALAAIYAEAAEYPLYEGFTEYSVTGASSAWLALQGVPAIAVELSNHTDTDWEQNLAGMLAVIETYSLEAVDDALPIIH